MNGMNEPKEVKEPKNTQPLDPTDDNLYKNLSLTDFIRSFVPQEQELRKEIQKINETKELPYLDASMPALQEELKQSSQLRSRNEKRRLELEKKKAKKKKDKLVKKVEVLMNNPNALKKAIDENPKIKDIALKIRDRRG